MSKYFNWKNGTNQTELEEIAKILQNDGIVVFPTETVYGIGGNALSENAIKNIYKAKGRELDNPLIVHIAEKEMIKDLVQDINEIEQKIIDKFMPGPITLILPKKEIVPDIVTANLDTVGIRMPINEVARKIIEQTKLPIAAPSANISGKPSGTNIDDIREELEGRVDAFIDIGNCEIGVESTVVKVIGNTPTILRPGKITKEDLEKTIGVVNLSKKIFEKVKIGEKVESPGMKYKHYAPNTKCILVCGTDEEQIEKINKMIEKDNNICVLGFKEHKEKINTEQYIEIGSKNNFSEISKNIFTLLRKADNYKASLILIEGIEKNGLGLAIMNRLIRTCEYNII